MAQRPIKIEARATVATAKKTPTFEAVVYTGGKLELAGWDLPVVIDLAGLEVANQLVVNLDHDPAKRVGNFQVTNNGSRLVANGTCSAATPWRDEVVNSAKEGFTWQASVEVHPLELETIRENEAVQINGRTFEGPLTITKRGRLTGFAFVSHGADDSTTVSIAAKAKRNMKMQNDEHTLPEGEELETLVEETIVEVLEDLGIDPEELTDEERQAVEALARRARAKQPGGKVAAEARRIGSIRSIAKSAEQDPANRYNIPTITQLATSAISDGSSVNQFELALIRGLRPKGPGIMGSNTQINQRTIEAALATSAGINVDRHYDSRTLDAANHAMRGIGLQQLLLRAAAENGLPAEPGQHVTQANLRSVLTHAMPASQQASGFSTFSLPGILSNIATKSLLEGWEETSGDEWKKISRIENARDFKEMQTYRLLDSLEYEQIGKDGEIKHGTVGETTLPLKIDTYGRMLAITREDIINDDLSALSDVPKRLGRAAGMAFRKVFWSLFLGTADNFWHSNNDNVKTGAGTALEVTGTALAAALADFRQQRTSDADGRKLIGGSPFAMMVPPALEIVARKLLHSTGTTGSDSQPDGNPFNQLCELLVVDWLSDSDFTGYSAAKWYLLRDPRIAPAMMVGFLNGVEAPTVETADADFNTLGIQMRGYHDFGVARGEPRCGIQMAGTPAES